MGQPPDGRRGALKETSPVFNVFLFYHQAGADAIRNVSYNKENETAGSGAGRESAGNETLCRKANYGIMREETEPHNGQGAMTWPGSRVL
jgi:hypothetical protein